MLTSVRNPSPLPLKQLLQIRGIGLHRLRPCIFNLPYHLHQFAGVVRVSGVARFLQSVRGLLWRIGIGDVGIPWIIGNQLNVIADRFQIRSINAELGPTTEIEIGRASCRERV